VIVVEVWFLYCCYVINIGVELVQKITLGHERLVNVLLAYP